ncbi:RecQ family ATP-dependent DNA helicase [Chelativorans alearense]|uniref:RecQ family ATP-dependent DNA helicase n=1 Tax=Chelativorans alearense TaxID=2681495 RepID=UPI001FE9591C|nr:RecQ family ATP-dependent DNA helicase [Chelativorans alearense]
MTDALLQLDDFAETAGFLLGHNILAFDLPHLEAAANDLRLLRKPAIDTLWLNPLAFPKNPYHHLVKHYQDGRLQGGHLSDPELDACLVLDLVQDQATALGALDRRNPDLAVAFHWLTTTGAHGEGFDAFFRAVRRQERPKAHSATSAVDRLLEGVACIHQVPTLFAFHETPGWPLAYALAWISVSGGDSVMPPWVRHQFPAASEIVRRLRDTPCSDQACAWCRTQNDPQGQLSKWFGFPGFRPEPKDEDGRPLQEKIVEAAIEGQSVLGILPTGTGKSICYQLPALAKFDKIGALTVVISPLVALMTDQVEGLRRQGISSCVAINGLLSLPERSEALDRVRLGDAAILLISPEQLRNPSVRTILKQREIGYWVIDEAHCLSKWGQDFRPDYRYISRFIREYSGDGQLAPLVCLTATAKPSVVRDILDHFQSRLGVELRLINGGAFRDNLAFEVIETTQPRKNGEILALLQNGLHPGNSSGAIVYCSTRNGTESVAGFLRGVGLPAEHFHAGLKPERKKEVQERFQRGELRVIAATNAFGMGIDKPDIRLVIHADIPGSLENYVQEAGRAGRDRRPARCILLFCGDDIERQFRLSAYARLTKREISAILRALRRLDSRTKRTGGVVATPGEIVRQELDREFTRDSATDDTRVKTAVAWLEESALLYRDENRVRVFPSCLKVPSLAAAQAILDRADLTPGYRSALVKLVQRLIEADPDQGISTDDLSGASGLTGHALNKALADLEHLGIASNDTNITVFLHLGVANGSRQRLTAACALEKDLIDRLRESMPDTDTHERSVLNLKAACQELRDLGHASVRPDVVERIVRGLARDGRDESKGIGSLAVRKRDRDHLSIALQREWGALAQTAEIRRAACNTLLAFLESQAEKGARGNDIQVEATLGALTGALSGDLEIRAHVQHLSKLLNRSLLWLHEQEVLILGRGLTVFRPAITVKLEPGSRSFNRPDFEPLRMHYDEQTLQIHIMAEYARQGLASMERAQALVEDYFTLERQGFLDRWLASRSAELRRQTSPDSWRAIVENLRNPVQARIVADDRELTNVLVLAGPGSGKTRVLVHRIAYLVRVRRENPRGILSLAYNRHAAVEIRTRLAELIGEDARGVTVCTCHGLAMRLVGASFAGRIDRMDTARFDQVMHEAIALLKGEGLSREEAEAQRETLLEGYRWILVDEYQDIGAEEYALISAVAGRSIEDTDARLSLFAVGDDDQNIYAFAGASVEFIRRFEADYDARASHLIENYRSTANIIRAANLVISPAAERMKAGHDIVIDRSRRNAREGGLLEKLDPIGRGRVQILHGGGDRYAQAVHAVDELQRIAGLTPDWDWSKAAVIAREWSFLMPVRSHCEAQGIPVQAASDELPNFWRLRETQALITWLKERSAATVSVEVITDWLDQRGSDGWWTTLRDACGELEIEVGDGEIFVKDILEWLAEWGRELRRKQTGLLLLSAHRAKGLEFDHVVVLDGNWNRRSGTEDADAARRLYYVAMTRAKLGLTLMCHDLARHPILTSVHDRAFLTRGSAAGAPDTSRCHNHYQTLDMSQIDLSFAGRLKTGHPSLAAIRRLRVGDEVKLDRAGNRWLLLDREGNTVSRLSQSYKPPEQAVFARGQVVAVTVRRREDSDAQYHATLLQDQWEVVVPELVFEK